MEKKAANKREEQALTGLFGHPVEHSLSPLFMNYIFRTLRIKALYAAFDITPEYIKDALTSLKILNFVGVNVTIPFKRAAFEYADVLTQDSRTIGAVNCLVNRAGMLKGYNTDHLGFIAPLEHRNVPLKGSTVLLIGCGGTARSALYALVRKGVENVRLLNRTKKNARHFITWSSEKLGFSAISLIGWGEALTQPRLDEADLIVNTTPVGMFPHMEANPLHGDLTLSHRHTVYDLIYNPWKTALLRKAEREGAIAINGFEMLILQGLHSLALWFPEQREDFFGLRERVIRYVKGQHKG